MKQRLTSPISAIKPRYDAIVVGSGYGGGVAAARLARAGKSVCVIERGREFVSGEFPTRFPELRSEMRVEARGWTLGSPSALYDVRVGEDMHVLVGCGVGGGSLVNAGVALRPDPRVFADSVWPDAVRDDGTLEEGYARARRWLRPAKAPRAREMVKFGAFAQAGAALGLAASEADVTVNFADTVNAAGVAQPACTNCGDCCSGCNVGAKTTVALTYLREARRCGAEIYARARAGHVSKAADGTWIVSVSSLDEESTAPEELTVAAPVVVLAAGTLGSNEILLRSAARGLALSDRLGRGFSANGDIIAFGYGAKTPVWSVGVGHPAKVEGREIGAAVSGMIEVRDEGALGNQLTILDGAVPSALAPMLPVLFIPNGRLLGALQSLISGVYNGPFTGLQTFFAVSHDDAGGRLRLANDKIVLSWPAAKDLPVYARIDAMLAALATSVRGAYLKNPLAGTVMGHQPATAHPLGGIGMGIDSTAGVVDHRCRVFDARGGAATTAVHAGLYVIDGSVMPRSLGCNPLLTITALAERAMIHFGRDHDLDMSDVVS
jgi:cholesterol oxidase